MSFARPAALAAALLSLACQTRAPASCPGTPLATFRFLAVPLAPAVAGDCPAGASDPISFTATLSTESGGGALLCVQRPEASPLRGSLVGQALSVVGPPVAAPGGLSGCSCPVQVTETVEGDLVAGGEGDGSDAGMVGFQGELRNALAAASTGGSCAADGGAGGGPCALPCLSRWALTGTR